MPAAARRRHHRCRSIRDMRYKKNAVVRIECDCGAWGMLEFVTDDKNDLDIGFGHNKLAHKCPGVDLALRRIGFREVPRE